MMHTNNKPRKTVVLQFPFKLGIANMRSLFKTNKVREHIMKKHLIAVVAAGIFSTNVFAVQPYIQAQVGKSDMSADIEDFDSFDDNDTYLGIGVGFKINKNLAFEISHKDFGEAEKTYTAGSESLKFTVGGDAISFAAVGILPIDASFSVFGKLGLDLWNGDAKATYDDGFGFVDSESDSDDGTDLFYAVGASYQITASTDVHIEYQVHEFDTGGDISSVDADVLAIGVNFGF